MTFQIINERTGEVIAEAAWLADKPWNRMLGLLGRSGLASGRAIVLRPGPSIHTLFMRFALDIVFVDQQGVVLKVVRQLKPFQFAAAPGARDAIEMTAGHLVINIAPGD